MFKTQKTFQTAQNQQKEFLLPGHPSPLQLQSTILRAHFLPLSGEPIPLCIDTGGDLSCMSDDYCSTYFPDSIRVPHSMNINSIGGAISSKEYVTVDLPLVSIKGELVHIPVSLAILPHLQCGMLLSTDTCLHAGFVIDFRRSIVSARGHEFTVHAKRTLPVPCSKAKHAILATETTIIPPHHGTRLSISHARMVTPDGGEDMLYQTCPIPQIALEHNSFGSIPAALISAATQSLPYTNFGDSPLKLRKGQLLGYVQPPSTVACTTATVNVAAQNKPLDNVDIPSAILEAELEPLLALEADVSGDFGPDYAFKIHQIIEKHRHLFRGELGRFNDGLEMAIPLKDETHVDGLKQAPYSLSRCDRTAMDGILDPLCQQHLSDAVPLDMPCPVASPAFVVWNNGKPRMVIDLRRLNECLIPNAYPLPCQDDVLGVLGGAVIFSSLDVTKGFFQQPLRKEDRWKCTFVTAHCGLERLNVSSMGLSTSLGFFQAWMERILSCYLWDFVLVYIDDIIIFSRSPDNHISHLDKILTLLKESGISLSLAKCHFAYCSVDLLGHQVSCLGVATTDKKVAIIRHLAFPETLQGLESGTQFFNYYQ